LSLQISESSKFRRFIIFGRDHLRKIHFDDIHLLLHFKRPRELLLLELRIVIRT
jgi:hypothetical protein